jgi:hypothetical protein
MTGDQSDPIQAGIVWAQHAADSLSRDFQYQHCSVFLFDVRAGSLILAAQRWGFGQDLGLVREGEWALPADGSICSRVFRTGRPALVPDVSLDPDYLSFPGARTRSELVVPLLMDGHPIGVINVESPRLGAYGIADLDQLRAFADRAIEEYRALVFQGLPEANDPPDPQEANDPPDPQEANDPPDPPDPPEATDSPDSRASRGPD